MTSSQAEKEAQAHQHLIGKIFEHHGSKRKCKIDLIERKLIKGSTSDYEVVVSATPMEKAVATRHVEELQYFLGTFRKIS